MTIIDKRQKRRAIRDDKGPAPETMAIDAAPKAGDPFRDPGAYDTVIVGGVRIPAGPDVSRFGRRSKRK